MTRFATHIVPLVLFGLVIIYASTRPLPELEIDIGNIDKLYHTGAYAVMGLLAARAVTGYGAWRGGRLSLAAVLAAAVFAFGGAIELYQLMIPGREGDVVDAVFNGVGGFTGSACWVWFFGPGRS